MMVFALRLEKTKLKREEELEGKLELMCKTLFNPSGSGSSDSGRAS